MALGRAGARLLLHEAARIGFRGRLLQLGPQVVHLRGAELRTYAGEAGLELPAEARALRDSELVPPPTFFRTLGFDEVESCDLFDRSATHVLDLNGSPGAPFLGRFDAVLDGGTMEHVFDTRRVLVTIHEVLAANGLAIHLAPVNNYVDHGFFAFSPQLFTSWYGVNGWSREAVWLLEHSRRWRRGPWRATPYQPGMLDRRSSGGWERGMLLLLSIYRKGPLSVASRIPQQGDDRPPPSPRSWLRSRARSAATLLEEVVSTDVVRLRPRRRLGATRRL